MNKYGAKKTEVDGILFDSAKEARRWAELKLLERAGEIKDLFRQMPFTLIPAQRDDKGKVIERPVKYVADFVYWERNIKDGCPGWVKVIEDAKSPATKANKEYILKRKLMLWRYGIRIREV